MLVTMTTEDWRKMEFLPRSLPQPDNICCGRTQKQSFWVVLSKQEWECSEQAKMIACTTAGYCNKRNSDKYTSSCWRRTNKPTKTNRQLPSLCSLDLYIVIKESTPAQMLENKCRNDGLCRVQLLSHQIRLFCATKEEHYILWQSFVYKSQN